MMIARPFLNGMLKAEGLQEVILANSSGRLPQIPNSEKFVSRAPNEFYRLERVPSVRVAFSSAKRSVIMRREIFDRI